MILSVSRRTDIPNYYSEWFFNRITRSIAKYGGDRMYFAPPIDYDTVMKKVPAGKVI